MPPTTRNPHHARPTPRFIAAIAALLFASQMSLPDQALADPPPWAPAHGYYKNKGKHEVRPGYRSEAGYHRSTYLADGRCNRDALGQVLGGVVGGLAGSKVGKGDGRTAATIAGTLLGMMIGDSVGGSMDRADAACVGQALEYGSENTTVAWSNPNTSARYQVTPGRSYERNGDSCREFTRESTIGGKRERIYGTACRQPDGSWRIVR